MASGADGSIADSSQLRGRSWSKIQHLHNARQKSQDSHKEQGKDDSSGDKKRTYGRTSDGTVFVVPQTHDMVSQLLSPSQPKNLSDLAILTVLAGLILTFYILPKSTRTPVFAAIFLFWRAAYNAGLGWLLNAQSGHNRLVLWAKNSHIFDDPATGDNPYPAVYRLLKQELETKIRAGYKFEDAPLEYNTWLVFRRLVDLILMSDFASYCLFAIACFSQPLESWLLWTLRWTTGVTLLVFNLWVKLDAHRVVKDYAWYWGDFFYLIDQNLTFDGVFEMAPHPMYSVGYAGYYGIALMMASYKVLAISIIAHATQFAFLALVESPHIEKIYNPAPSRRARQNPQDANRDASPKTGQVEVDHDRATYNSVIKPSPMQHLVGPSNTDFHRSIDVTVYIVSFYMLCLALLTPQTSLIRTLFFINACIWRLWCVLGLGYILDRQSKKKNWTRHFIKYGDTKEEAWRQWKYLYHISMTMNHASFVAVAWKMYTFPADCFHGLTLLRHVLGVGMIALQIWVATSIYDSLGEFGWFCGDFFFDPPSKNLTYSGIYRFLNNPERILGFAGIWGTALITWNAPIFYLAATAHILALAFLQFVERPHMTKLYGRKLRKTSGVSKTFRQALPSPVRSWQSAADDYLHSTVEFVEELLDNARPKLAAGVDHFFKDTTALFRSHPARISITRLPHDLAGVNPEHYQVKVESVLSHTNDAHCGNERKDIELSKTLASLPSEFKTLTVEYGVPIRVSWQAPLNHSKKDWIGLYKITDNQSRRITRISSNGRWIATSRGAYDSIVAEEGILVSDQPTAINATDDEPFTCCTGKMEFRSDKLWWTTGVFEFRYHHNGKHHVMARSQAFEVRIPRFDDDNVEVDANGTIHNAVQCTLLPLVQNCFDRDPEIAPSTSEESFGCLVERDDKFAKRVVFAVRQMFGIEFAPEVVQADGNVRNLAWRICNAKKVLAPYSMTASRGRNTPTSMH